MEILKRTFFRFGIIAVGLTTFVSCQDDDKNSTAPSAQQFNTVRQAALDSRTQHFEFDTDNGNIQLTSLHGVQIYFNADCLTKNGNSVTGQATLEFVEIFGGGDMAVTNKPTMGRMDNGNQALLLSGGEFFIQAYQAGEKLDINCGITLLIPSMLTGGINNDMTLWKEWNNDTAMDTISPEQVVWEEVNNQADQENFVGNEGSSYIAYFNTFGWTNVDCFYSDPRPKTTILADVPSGYDNTNSSVYLSYDGRGNALANLDTYENGLFSEHYGQIPIGLECHAIFITEENGMYRYAIKPAVIEAGMIITFSMDETVTGTEAELVAAISAVQD